MPLPPARINPFINIAPKRYETRSGLQYRARVFNPFFVETAAAAEVAEIFDALRSRRNPLRILLPVIHSSRRLVSKTLQLVTPIQNVLPPSAVVQVPIDRFA